MTEVGLVPERPAAASPYQQDWLTGRIIECIIQVHRKLGPGFVENVYRRALLIELRKQGLVAEVERRVVVYYEGQEVGRHHLDLLVEEQVLVELKAVKHLARVHYAQVRSSMKAAGLHLAILVNFDGDKADFRRVEIF